MVDDDTMTMRKRMSDAQRISSSSPPIILTQGEWVFSNRLHRTNPHNKSCSTEDQLFDAGFDGCGCKYLWLALVLALRDRCDDGSLRRRSKNKQMCRRSVFVVKYFCQERRPGTIISETWIFERRHHHPLFHMSLTTSSHYDSYPVWGRRHNGELEVTILIKVSNPSIVTYGNDFVSDTFTSGERWISIALEFEFFFSSSTEQQAASSVLIVVIQNWVPWIRKYGTSNGCELVQVPSCALFRLE